MKAAVLKELGTTPVYEDFPEPKASNENELIINVKAAALKNIDKFLTLPGHYAAYKKVPTVVGLDGIGVLDNGQKVYAVGLTGAFAEKMKIAADNYTPLPDNIDATLAAAIPNAALGSFLPLFAKGKIKEGDTVLFNGATGITGKFGIQVAKIFGAQRIIVLGRIEGREQELTSLGATDLISSSESDKAIIEKIEKINHESPITIVMDYLWGHPLELILNSLGGKKGQFPQHETKVINMGSLSGDKMEVSSNTIRSSKTTIIGAGLGSYTQEEFKRFYQEYLPQAFNLAGEGKIKVDLQVEKLENIESIWNQTVKDKRVVFEV